MLATKIIKKVLEEMIEPENCKGLLSILAAIFSTWQGWKKRETVEERNKGKEVLKAAMQRQKEANLSIKE